MTTDLKIEEVHVLELYIVVGYPVASGRATTPTPVHEFGPVCVSLEQAQNLPINGEKRIFKVVVPTRYDG